MFDLDLPFHAPILCILNAAGSSRFKSFKLAIVFVSFSIDFDYV